MAQVLPDSAFKLIEDVATPIPNLRAALYAAEISTVGIITRHFVYSSGEAVEIPVAYLSTEFVPGAKLRSTGDGNKWKIVPEAQ